MKDEIKENLPKFLTVADVVRSENYDNEYVIFIDDQNNFWWGGGNCPRFGWSQGVNNSDIDTLICIDKLLGRRHIGIASLEEIQDYLGFAWPNESKIKHGNT